MAPAIERGFSTHGGRHALGELAHFRVVEQMHELGHVQACFHGLHAHGQLVAKIARGGLAHARNAQMLAQRGGHFQIEIVERHYPVDNLRCAPGG